MNQKLIDKSILVVNNCVLKPKWLCRYNNNSETRSAILVFLEGLSFFEMMVGLVVSGQTLYTVLDNPSR